MLKNFEYLKVIYTFTKKTMNILLAINLEKINASHWQNTYEKVKMLINAFPVEPMFLRETKYEDESYYEWTRDIIQNENTGDEYIGIKGDWVSYERGGLFTLYKKLAAQQKDILKSKDVFSDKSSDDKCFDKQKDVLWLPDTHTYFQDGHINANFAVWDNGTKGAPYALLILAIGILLENEFGENAFLHGEFNEIQAEKMLAWLNDVLVTNYDMPIAFDNEQLWERTSRAYPENASFAIERFRAFSLCSPGSQMEFLYKFEAENLEKHILEHIKGYNSFEQWGVHDYILPYLEATQDVEALVKLAKKAHTINNEKDFSLTVLLSTICDKSITINPMDHHAINQWNDTGEHLVSGMEKFNRLFMKMGGLPNSLKYYIHQDELLEIFAYYEPKNGAVFKQIIEENDAKCRENIKKLEKASDDIQEIAEQSDNMIELDDDLLRLSYYRNEDFICEQIAFQQRKFKFAPDYMKKLGKDLIAMVKQYDSKTPSRPFCYLYTTKKEYIKAIFGMIAKRDFAVRDTVVRDLEKVENLEILKLLFAYCSVHEREINFFHIRIYVLENPNCYMGWEKLLER